MKNFFGIVISLLALFGAAIGALAIVDRLKNKNRIKGEYLECETIEGENEEE